MAVVVWLLVAATVLTFAIITYFLHVSRKRTNALKRRVALYQVGEVYADRDGDEWLVTYPGRLASPALSISFSMDAHVVEEKCGPLTFVRREEVPS